MNRRRFMGAAVAISTGIVSGCTGGDGGGEQAAQPTTAPPQAPAESPTAEPSGETQGQQAYPDYNWGVLGDADPSFTSSITLRNTQFNPLIAEVPVGTPISFTNEDSYEHTVTIPALNIDERLAGGASTTVTFDQLETYDYVCTLHQPSMLGRIIVTEETPKASPTPEETSSPSPTPSGGDGGYY